MKFPTTMFRTIFLVLSVVMSVISKGQTLPSPMTEGGLRGCIEKYMKCNPNSGLHCCPGLKCLPDWAGAPKLSPYSCWKHHATPDNQTTVLNVKKDLTIKTESKIESSETQQSRAPAHKFYLHLYSFYILQLLLTFPKSENIL